MEAIARANSLVQAGRLRDASALLSQVLRSAPGDREATRLLAQVQFQSGHHRDGIRLAKRLVSEVPHDPQAWNALGLMQHLTGEDRDAEESFRRAVDADPEYAEGWTNLGYVLERGWAYDEAIRALQQAIDLDPGRVSAQFFLGNALAATSQHRAAIERYDIVLEADPSMAEAWNNRGNSLLALGQPREASQALEKAVRLAPGNAAFLSNLATAYHRQGRSSEGIALLKGVDSPEASRARAAILSDLGRLDEAATDLDPSDPASLTLLARILQNQGRWREAIQRLSGSPDVAHQILRALSLPVVLVSPDEIEESRASMADGFARVIDSGNQLSDPLQQVGATTFFLAYHGIGERKLQEQVADAYLKITPRLNFHASHSPAKSGRIRLGICSAFLHDHTIGKLFAPAFGRLDQERFEIVFLQLGPRDTVSQDLAERVSRTVILTPSLFEAMEAVAREELDMLIYPETGMDPQTYFMSFSRLAPTQCALWGHPMTTGSPTMDYFLSSESLETPLSEPDFRESIVRLPTLTTFYLRPPVPPPLGPGDFGLPTDRHLYGCLQTLFKFHPDFDRVLAEILERDERGLLVLLEPKAPYWKRLLRERWRRTHPRLIERSVFLPSQPRERYLSLSRLCHAILDPIQFGGGNSSLECFAVGAPVVTLPGKLLRNRITYAAYRQLDWLDLVVPDETGYVNAALRLAHDDEWRHATSEAILDRAEVLFENRRAVDDLQGWIEQVAR